MTRDSARAEDATQEAFVSLLRHASKFDASRPFAPWWQSILLNMCIQNFQGV